MFSKKTKGKPSIIDRYIGKRIRIRRSLMGLSQQALGERLDITFQQIQKYEKGKNRVAASRLYEIARILEVPFEYFFIDVEKGGSL